jgi:hypothetical protein
MDGHDIDCSLLAHDSVRAVQLLFQQPADLLFILERKKWAPVLRMAGDCHRQSGSAPMTPLSELSREPRIEIRIVVPPSLLSE